MTHAFDIDPLFASWFAGFLDGEGTFNIHYLPRQGTYQCRVAIFLRDDDAEVLQQIQAHTGVGTIGFMGRGKNSTPNANPNARWVVTSRGGCLRIIEILDHFPLRAKKKQDFEIWREAVVEWCEVSGRANVGRLPELKGALEAVRKYRGQASSPQT